MRHEPCNGTWDVHLSSVMPSRGSSLSYRIRPVRGFERIRFFLVHLTFPSEDKKADFESNIESLGKSRN